VNRKQCEEGEARVNQGFRLFRFIRFFRSVTRGLGRTKIRDAPSGRSVNFVSLAAAVMCVGSVACASKVRVQRGE
jgi:hypothetical protein